MQIRTIQRGFWSDLADAPQMIEKDLYRVPLANLQEIPIKPFAQLAITERITDGHREYVAKLAFKTTDDTLQSQDRKVFYALDVNSHVWVLGSKQRPYAVVTKSVSLPESAEDNQLDSYQVDYTSILPILYRAAT